MNDKSRGYTVLFTCPAVSRGATTAMGRQHVFMRHGSVCGAAQKSGVEEVGWWGRTSQVAGSEVEQNTGVTDEVEVWGPHRVRDSWHPFQYDRYLSFNSSQVQTAGPRFG